MWCPTRLSTRSYFIFEKTNFLIFHTHQKKLSSLVNLKIIKLITQEKQVKYLGILIDSGVSKTKGWFTRVKQAQGMESFHCLALAFALASQISTCEPIACACVCFTRRLVQTAEWFTRQPLCQNRGTAWARVSNLYR